MSSPVLDAVTSVKVKLGLLVAISVTVASVVASIGAGGGVPFWLSVPVTVALALGVTQLLATGMTSPLREMTVAARRMARGDYSTRVTATSTDEVGELAGAFNRIPWRCARPSTRLNGSALWSPTCWTWLASMPGRPRSRPRTSTSGSFSKVRWSRRARPAARCGTRSGQRRPA